MVEKTGSQAVFAVTAGSGKYCSGYGGQLFGKSVFRGIQIKADAQNCVIQKTAFHFQGGFRENPADLSSVHIDVVDPFNSGGLPGNLFDGLTGGYGSHGGEAHSLPRRSVFRTQKQAHVHTRVIRRIEAPSRPAAAGTLACGQDGCALRRARCRSFPETGISGIYQGQYLKIRKKTGRIQMFSDTLDRKDICIRGKAVSAVLYRVYLISILPEPVYSLPDGCSGN